MLSIDRLRALLAVREHGSIAGAAVALHLTPSGVSQQLGKLEREVGQQLLEPVGRSVRLTHAGKVLCARAQRVVAELTEAAVDMADLNSEVLGPLRIGAVGSAIRDLLPPVLSRMAERYPRLVPSVRDGEAIDLVPALVAGELDVAVVESWANRPMYLPEGLRAKVLVAETAELALAEQHPLADRTEVDLGELAGLTWVSCPEWTAPREALVQALRASGLEPDVRFSIADHATQLALVAAGVTAALIPAMARSAAPATVRFVPTRPALRREVRLAWRADNVSPTVRACVAAFDQT